MGAPLQRHIVRAGDLLISPAYSQEWLRRLEQADFLNLYLEPTLINQIAETCTRLPAGDRHLGVQRPGQPGLVPPGPCVLHPARSD